jgi:hypothetical protein
MTTPLMLERMVPEARKLTLEPIAAMGPQAAQALVVLAELQVRVALRAALAKAAAIAELPVLAGLQVAQARAAPIAALAEPLVLPPRIQALPRIRAPMPLLLLNPPQTQATIQAAAAAPQLPTVQQAQA